MRDYFIKKYIIPFLYSTIDIIFRPVLPKKECISAWYSHKATCGSQRRLVQKCRSIVSKYPWTDIFACTHVLTIHTLGCNCPIIFNMLVLPRYLKGCRRGWIPWCHTLSTRLDGYPTLSYRMVSQLSYTLVSTLSSCMIGIQQFQRENFLIFKFFSFLH